MLKKYERVSKLEASNQLKKNLLYHIADKEIAEHPDVYMRDHLTLMLLAIRISENISNFPENFHFFLI